MKVCPTLFIGIGGTGKEILLRLRRRILTADWNGKRLQDFSEFPIASFLYFDLDITDVRVRETSDPLADKVAFQAGEVCQRPLDLAMYMRDLERFPLIKEWWPKKSIERLHFDNGPLAVRPISRLYFFSRVGELKEIIQWKGNELTASLNNEQALEALGLETEKYLRIIVIASAAGGTGSGSFLDMGYLACTVFPEAETNLILLLPTGFYMGGSVREGVCANAYAALMELEYCMRGNKYVEKWTDLQEGVVVETPYNEVYPLDTANMAGMATGRIEDLFNMITDTLFDDFASGELAEAKRRVRVIQRQYKVACFRPDLGDVMGGKLLMYSRIYSSFGRACLDIDTQASSANTNPSFLDAFTKLSVQEKVSLLRKLLVKAMPWIDADLTGNFYSSYSPSQYRAFIVVKNSVEFERRYGALLDQVVPLEGLQRNCVLLVDSGMDDRMICYVELSGIPLDVIRPLRSEWYVDYRNAMERGLPLHNHWDYTRFPHPVVPMSQDTARITDK
jgi:hypothetical protein